MAKKKEKKAKVTKTKICPACHAEIPAKAKLCPFCAEKQKVKSKLPLIIALAVVVLLVGAFVSMAIFEFPIALPFDVPFLSGSKPETLVGETMELTKEQEKEVLAGLEECGFAEIKEVDLIKFGAKSSTYAVQDIWTAQFMEKEDAAVVEIANGDLRGRQGVGPHYGLLSDPGSAGRLPVGHPGRGEEGAGRAGDGGVPLPQRVDL